MTNRELVKLLMKYPSEMEVQMEVNNMKGIPTDIDWIMGGVNAQLMITDYPLLKADDNP